MSPGPFSVFVRPAGSDHAYSEVEVHPDDAVTDFVRRAVAKCGWDFASSRVRLFLVERASMAHDPTVDEESIALSKPSLPSTSLLTVAGVEHNSCLLARVDGSDAGVRISLLVNSADKFGELSARSVSVVISTQKELEVMIKHNGGGSLVLEDDTSTSVTKVSALVEGGIYSLIGGTQAVVKRHRTWTQTAALAHSAIEAVYDATIEELSVLEKLHNTRIMNKAGQEQEFDGLLIHSKVAFFIEAKHSAQLEHLHLLRKKLEFLEGVVGDGSFPRFAGIERVVPVLASPCFSPEMMELCKLDSIGIVKPSHDAWRLGGGVTLRCCYIPSASLKPTSKPTPVRHVLHVGLVSRLCCWWTRT